MKPKLFSAPNLYLVLWALYYTQGFLLPQGTFISRLVLLIYLSVSLYYVFYANIEFKLNGYFKVFNVLILMFTVYGLADVFIYNFGKIVLPSRTVNSFDYLKLIYLSLLPTYAFYAFTRKQLVDETWIKRAFFLCFGVMVVQYVVYLNRIKDSFEDEAMQTINVGYEFISLIPMVFFFRKRPVLQYVLLTIIYMIVISTVKRGAIFTGAICLVYFIYATLSNASRRSRWFVIPIVLFFLFFGSRYVSQFYENSEYAQLRMEQTLEGNSSGRDVIFGNAWDTFIKSNFLQLAFGQGAHGTIKSMGIMAHNDWLELLVNQGLFGVFLYLCYWLAFYVDFRRNKDPNTRPIMGIIVLALFVSSWFSFSYGSMYLPMNLCLGYCLAEQQLVKKVDSN